MSSAKTISDYERARHLVLHGDLNPGQEVTADQFEQLVQDYGFVAIDHERREAWLQEQGYEVTRDNMRDVTLPSNASKRSQNVRPPALEQKANKKVP